MEIFTKKDIKTIEDAFVHELSDVYSAEKQLTEALPKMRAAAANAALAEGFETHLTETFGQLKRLDRVAEICGFDLKDVTCAAMKGLVKEGDEIIAHMELGAVRDAMLIAAAQKVEHYEIATYGTLVELAEKLGYSEASALLSETLDEEKSTDQKLNMLATSQVNDAAIQMSPEVIAQINGRTESETVRMH
jgi:ferritin-like metal-binding protein YciE